jgi:hypothetical protein
VIYFVLFIEDSVENFKNCLESIFQEEVGVVVGNQFIGNDDEFGIIFDVGRVD